MEVQEDVATFGLMTEGAMVGIDEETNSLRGCDEGVSALIRRMSEAAEPIVLSVNGAAQLVIQDGPSFQMLLELVDHLETVEALKEGLEDVASGRTYPAREALEDLRVKHGLPR